MSGTGNTPALTAFTAGDLVISVYGDGDGSGNYTDNQASPIVLEELSTSGSFVGQMVLPQTTTTVNGTTEYAISGEYGSSSEGSLQLSADGQSLTIMGYSVNAATFNSGGAAVYGNAALAQSTSVPGGPDTPVARLVADIGYNGTVDTSTAVYNIDNTNNPRSVATVNGTSFYISGQGVKGDTTQGVFLAHDGAANATAIDTSTDTRTVEIYNGALYVSRDSTQGPGGTANISNYGSTLPISATAPTVLPGIDGTVTLTAADTNAVNTADLGQSVNLSPENFFFANPNTLYVADSGNPKAGGLGDGGLQKWVFNGSAWTLEYTLSAGLGLVADTGTAGTTGLIGLTGTVVGGTVQLYATNATLGDLDPTFLFGITDTLDATSGAGESFTTLATAAPDTNIRGVSFAPTQAATTPAVTTVTSGTTQSNLVITSGSELDVLSGGTVIGATILSGGSATIEVGGVDSATSLAHGATETVLGQATGDQIDGTQLVSAATAIVNDETIYNGGVVDLFLKGVTANGLDVLSGGTLNISGNVTANDTVINGGVVDLQSAKAAVGQSLTFAGPGTLEVSALSSAGFGVLAVISGFGVGDVIDETAIGAGASFATATSGGNTVATITSGSVTESFTFAGTAIASGLSLISDGTGGQEIAFQAPPVVTSVTSGMTLSNFVVTSGSSLEVLSGGTIVAATVQSGGLATVAAGGIDSGSTITAGGNETVLGQATGDQIFGQQLVSAATATVNNEIVENGGSLDLFLKGVTATGVTVLSGGELNISGNATTSNTVIQGGVVELQSPKGVLAGSLTFDGPGTLAFTAVISAGFGDFAVISGFGAGDVIDETVIGSGATLATSVSGGNTVATITSGGVSESFTFAGTAIGPELRLVTSGGATELVTCFVAGTQISTPHGDMPVEQLAIGDAVTVAGPRRAPQPISWIGHRRIAISRHPSPEQVLPIRIQRGAFGRGLPRRDLLLSPDHAVFAAGVLVPVRYLVNGSTIVQLVPAACSEVTYYHIELPRHDVVLAEGLTVESYLDTGSRSRFSNGGGAIDLFPDFATRIWEAEGCAPLCIVGDKFDRLCARLSAIAGKPAKPTGRGAVRRAG